MNFKIHKECLVKLFSFYAKYKANMTSHAWQIYLKDQTTRKEIHSNNKYKNYTLCKSSGDPQLSVIEGCKSNKFLRALALLNISLLKVYFSEHGKILAKF